MKSLPLFFLLLGLITLSAVEEYADGENNADKSTEQKKTALKDLGEGKYSIGLIQFDANTRRISFPAEVNQIEGLLEFAIVHEKGKIHESLLTTKASSLNLNIALKLLRYQSSPELFPELDEKFESTGKYPIVPEAQKTASRLKILVSWQKDSKTVETSLNELLYHTSTEEAMKPDPWVYQGSYMHENAFKAETSGDIVAVFITRSSLVNFSGKDNETDDPWTGNIKRVPPVTTPVTVTFAPLLEKK